MQRVRSVCLMTGFILFLGIHGCVVVSPPPSHPGPSGHAPAHGYRAQYRYQFYPDASVYFDLDRRLYFYLDGGWRSAEFLPHALQTRLGRAVFMEMDAGEPYLYYDEHRMQYPSDQTRKKRK